MLRLRRLPPPRLPRLRLTRKAAVALILMAALFGMPHGGAPRGQHATAGGPGHPTGAKTPAATTPAAPNRAPSNAAPKPTSS